MGFHDDHVIVACTLNHLYGQYGHQCGDGEKDVESHSQRCGCKNMSVGIVGRLCQEGVGPGREAWESSPHKGGEGRP